MIKGKNVALRKVESEDLQMIRDWFTQKSYIKALSGSLLEHLIEERLNIVTEENSKFYGGEKLFIIEDMENNSIGFLLYSFIQWRNKNLTLEIFLKPDMQDKIYGMEAIVLGLCYAFDHLNMHKVSIFINEFNKNALGIAKKTSTFEGILRNQAYFNGEYKNVHVFSILKSEFDAQKKDALKLGYDFVEVPIGY